MADPAVEPIESVAGAPETIEAACRDCGATFVSTAEERLWARARGFAAPSRCPACRARRREERNARVLAGYEASASVGLNAPGRAPADGSNTVGPPHGRAAICTDCGRATRVPFRPWADRPVFCRGCWERRNGH